MEIEKRSFVGALRSLLALLENDPYSELRAALVAMRLIPGQPVP
jgi:hypothetical protein